MGASAGGHCFESLQLAAQAECNAYPRSSADGGNVTTWSCTGVSEDGSTLALMKRDTAGGQVAQTLVVSYLACDENQSTNDMVSLWWAGVAALLGVYLVKQFVFKLVANQ